MKILILDSEKKLAECAKLYVRASNGEPWNDQWTEETAFNRLLDFFNSPGYLGLYAEEGSGILGALVGNAEQFYSGSYFYLKEMFVLPEHQRKGIGTGLLNELKRILDERGIRSIQLFTSKKLFPFSFYKKHGFEIVKNMVMMNNDPHFGNGADEEPQE